MIASFKLRYTLLAVYFLGTVSAAAVTAPVSIDCCGGILGAIPTGVIDNPDVIAYAIIPACDFKTEIVNYHNQVRSQHRASNLVWNSTIASYASNYVNKVGCNFGHSGGPYGENIAMGYDTPLAAMQAWYNEVSDYDYNNPGFSSSTGHFTQMVWADTTSVGCAQAPCSGSPYLVCEYYPHGNVIGYFAENVHSS